MLGIEYHNYTVAVDADKCVACGACGNICSCGVLEVGDKAVLAHPERCMGCGHCTAVCPTRAIHAVKRANAPESQPAPVPTEDFGDKKQFVPFEEMARHVCARRSIRNFTDEIPSRELLEKVLMAARYAPTACNYRLLKYALITDPEHIKTLRELCMKRYPMPRVLLPSPCLLLVMGPKFAQEDVSIATTTFDLVSRSVGLGCTFAGLIKMAIAEVEEVLPIFVILVVSKPLTKVVFQPCTLASLVLKHPSSVLLFVNLLRSPGHKQHHLFFYCCCCFVFVSYLYHC